MVSIPGCRFLAAGLAMLALSLLAEEPLDYRVGETIKSDIIAPVTFRVEGQDARASNEVALKVPVIFHHDRRVADKVEKDMRAAFGAMRTNFTVALGWAYQRKQLNLQTISSQKFQSLSATFCQKHRNFPQLANLVELWAVGLSDADIQAGYLFRLRDAMKQPIRDALPADLPSGPLIWLTTNVAPSASFESVAKNSDKVALTNLISLSQARADFESRQADQDAVAAKFLASFLKPNCHPQPELTRRFRSELREPSGWDNYAAGQVIARRGQRADAKIVAALERLKTIPRSEWQSPQDHTPATIAWLIRLNPWLWVGVAIGAAGLVFWAWRLLNRKKPVSIVPARIVGDGAAVGILSCPSCRQNIVVPGPAGDASNAGYFSEWVKQKLILGLFADRRQLLDAQKFAATELAEMERRLDELKTPLDERLRAYEKRISELEQMLTVKGEENRELLRAKIQMTRQQLEAARSRTAVELN